MNSRSKRASKIVNYAAFETTDSDDDFSEFTPPTKKKHNSKICRENSVSDPKESTAKLCITLENKSPKQQLRQHVDERKFQRDLKMALQLSGTNNKEFQGFDKVGPPSIELESFSPPRKSVITVEIHSADLSEDKNLKINDQDKDENRTVLCDTSSSTPTDSLSSMKLKKKVNFAEDDESDDFSDASSTGSLDSDFSSPKKRKKKKLSSKSKKDCIKSVPVVKSPALSRKNGVKESPKAVLATLSANNPSLTCSNSKPTIRSSHEKAQEQLHSKPNMSIKKLSKTESKEFKSPALKSSLPVPKIGLRLGLSRRALTKPLHPKAGVS